MAVQMHAYCGAETLDDIVVTFGGQYGIKRKSLGLELGIPKLWRKFGEGNDARQNLCRPKPVIWMTCRRVEATPSAGRRPSPRLVQGRRDDPVVAAVPDLL